GLRTHHLHHAEPVQIGMDASQNPDFIPTAALRKKILAYISLICGAANFFPLLAFGRTLNF
ncbi:MAG TPA: hypothetical protein VFW53_01140, partial [Gallionella sp.]|nr:hypothetical protein [Gallionella sp.]